MEVSIIYFPLIESTIPKRNIPATKNIIIKLHSVLSETGRGPLFTTTLGGLEDSTGESSNGAKANAINYCLEVFYTNY